MRSKNVVTFSSHIEGILVVFVYNLVVSLVQVLCLPLYI